MLLFNICIFLQNPSILIPEKEYLNDKNLWWTFHGQCSHWRKYAQVTKK